VRGQTSTFPAAPAGFAVLKFCRCSTVKTACKCGQIARGRPWGNCFEILKRGKDGAMQQKCFHVMKRRIIKRLNKLLVQSFVASVVQSFDCKSVVKM
jgi:hypothetical protein